MEKIEHEKTMHDNKILSAIAYLGPLVIVSYFINNKKDAFTNFHIGQGAVLFIIEIILIVLDGMFWRFGFIFMILNLIVLALTALGIVNVFNNKKEELPVVGTFAKNLKI